MHPTNMFLIAALDAAGLKGFIPHPDNDPDKGRLSLINPQGQRIQYGYRFNGGNAMWFHTGGTRDIPNDLLPMPFRGPQ